MAHSSSLKKSITGHIHLDMLENWLIPQLETDTIIYQQDGAHYHLNVHDFLNTLVFEIDG